MTPADMNRELVRLSRQLDAALTETREKVQEFAESERDYRKAKARAWIEAPDGTVPERDAWVSGKVADSRYKRDLADGMRQIALETVRARRAQLSAWQTAANMIRSEAELAKFGPDEAA